MRKLLISASALAVLAVAGCASIGRQTFTEPVVTLQDVSINGLGLTGGSLDVVLSVYNPNRFALDATRLTYNIVLDTIPLATGALNTGFVVQERDTAEVRIPVTFTYSGIGEAGRQLLNTGTVNYRVRGDVTVATPIGQFTRPYDRTGRFSALSGTRE